MRSGACTECLLTVCVARRVRRTHNSSLLGETESINIFIYSMEIF